MIELGLTRIRRLLQHSKLSWRAVHVAGTNGKGSICAYASAILTASHVHTGRFTSPHIIDRWDCIAINDRPVAESLFKEVENRVKWWDQKEDIRATEFELLTATAFEIFNHEKVDVGVVEVGMGGRLDATNVLENPLVTVLSGIGLDHQEFLGSTIEAIAREKAGILKLGVPCVVDSTNEESVQTVIKTVANDVGATLQFINLGSLENYRKGEHTRLEYLDNCQLANYECAKQAAKLSLKQLGQPLENPIQDHAYLESNPLPGRMQRLNISSLVHRKQEILLDGAHNFQSASLLGKHVDRLRWLQGRQAHECGHSQNNSKPVTWVLATKKDKNIADILSCLLRPGDKVVATAFGPVDGMPWVEAMSPESLLQIATQTCVIDKQSRPEESVLEALQFASSLAHDEPLVIAGSLYLVGDVSRALRDVGNQA